MSIVPLLSLSARDFDTELRHWSDIMDDDFGFGIHPLEIFRPRINHPTSSLLWHPRRRYAPYERHVLSRRHSGAGGRLRDTDINAASSSLIPQIGKDGFQACIDVSQFKPNELTVKTVDRNIIIEGQHEEREDEHGLIQRHFVRKYLLPKEYDPKEVVSTISSDGVLTVKAPPPPNKAIKQNERIVQIQQTGPAHLNVKAPAPELSTSSSSSATTDGKNGTPDKK